VHLGGWGPAGRKKGNEERRWRLPCRGGENGEGRGLGAAQEEEKWGGGGPVRCARARGG
jgi:hypothetical protein